MKNNYTFKTNSDTEVLLDAYKVYVKRILSMLNGCFAFAIYNTKERTLFFARDRLDKKWMKNELFQFCEYNLQYFMDLDSFNGETIKKCGTNIFIAKKIIWMFGL